MKKFLWFVSGMAAAAAGFLVWNSNRVHALQQPAYYLDDDPSEDPTFI